MSFDPCNRSLKIQESTGTPTLKVGVPLGVWGFIPSHSFAFPGAWNVTPRLPSWPASLLQALCFGRKPKARVATTWVWSSSHLDLVCFYSIKGFLLILFLLYMQVVQNKNIHRSVVLSPKTFGMSRWMPKSTQLHLKAICLVEVFTKQPLGHIRIVACIHLATCFWAFMNPFILFHCISMFILHWMKNLLKCRIWV